MSYFASPEFLRVLVLGFITSAHMTWRRLVNQLVSEPYLDEFFHVPQVQAYWLGNWSQWDPKITTPPGLYVFSYVVNSVRNFFSKEGIEPSITEWRLTNVLLLYLLLFALYILAAVGRRNVHPESVLQREFSIICFPLIFFFSSIYYTDLFSVFTVVLAQISWSASTNAKGSTKVLHQTLHLVAGLVAFAARQTNIFWVAVYLGGLQVIDSIKSRVGAHKVHDPPVSESYFEGSHGPGFGFSDLMPFFLITFSDGNFRLPHHKHFFDSSCYDHASTTPPRPVATAIATCLVRGFRGLERRRRPR